MLNSEFLEIASKLEEHHAVFSMIWKLGKPNFSDKIPTAAVSFDKAGEVVDFSINEEFWNSIDNNKKLFVVCHECLHIILYHGIRFIELEGNDLQAANKAADIVDNHLLISRFGFNREEIDPNNEYCWIDTIFDNSDEIKENQNFEYYYNLIRQQSENGGGMGEGQLVDSHEKLESFSNADFEGVIRDTLGMDGESIEDLVRQHTEDIEKEIHSRGLSPGNTWYTAKDQYVAKKKKWETVIKKWSAKYMKEKEVEQWTRLNRRLHTISSELMLPSDMEVDDYEKDRIRVWFFQDTSGSCYHFRDRFFKAAKSLPPERFDIKMHCFDTQVFATTLESRQLYGFGGTSFTCIESYIQRYIRENNESYPKAVFVITDGYGNSVYPQYPKTWYWFLSTNYNYCIPKESHIYKLTDYE